MFATTKLRLYTYRVIIGFKHKGLEKFFGKGIKSGIQAKHAERLRLILGRLNVSMNPRDMALPGLDPAWTHRRSQRDLVREGQRQLARDI